MVHALAAPEVVQEERENRGVNTRARELGSSIMSDQAFRIWLERQEVKIEKKVHRCMCNLSFVANIVNEKGVY